MRWELDTPLDGCAAHVQTFRPGQTSTVYPCTIANPDALGNPSTLAYCPTGLVVPGDPGVPGGSDFDVLKGICAAHRPCLQSRTLPMGFWGSCWAAMVRPVYVPVGGCSTTRWSSWCWNSSALSRPLVAAQFLQHVFQHAVYRPGWERCPERVHRDSDSAEGVRSGLGRNYSPDLDVWRFPAAPADTIHRPVQFQHSTGTDERPSLANQLRGIARASAAGSHDINPWESSDMSGPD